MKGVAAKQKANATKRIMRDLKEIQENAILGCTLIPLDEDNPFVLHANVRILEGSYKNLILHIELKMPDNFPLHAPFGAMAPNFPLIKHPHVFSSGICTDFLSNFDHFQKVAAAGWTSNNFKCTKCNHTTKNPFPPIPSQTTPDQSSNQQVDLFNPRQRAEQYLICSVEKASLFDEKQMVLGYPLKLSFDRRNRLESEIITDLVSYNAFVMEIMRAGFNKLDSFISIYFRSPTGKEYNNWIPVYINEDHFQRGGEMFKNMISVISSGSMKGISSNDFNQQMVLRVIPAILNKNTVQMFQGSVYESESAIIGFCHILRTFFKWVELYPQIRHKMQNDLQAFYDSWNNRSKDRVPDIGEFLIKLFVCRDKFYNYKNPKMQKAILEEYYARQIFWILKDLPKFKFELQDINQQNILFKQTQVSNKLLIFNIQSAKTFIFPGVEQKLDENYGLPPEAVLNKFQENIKKIKSIMSFKTVFQAIGFDEVQNPTDLTIFYNNALQISERRGYHQGLQSGGRNFRSNRPQY